MSFPRQALLAAVMLLLLCSWVAARQLDTADKNAANEEHKVMQQNSATQAEVEAAQPHRALAWDLFRGRTKDQQPYRSYDRQGTRDGPYAQQYDNRGPQDMQQGRGYDRGYSRQDPYDGYNQQQDADQSYRSYNRQGPYDGYNQQQDVDQSYRSYDRTGARDESIRAYDRQGVRDVPYEQYGNRDERYQQYSGVESERDQGRWQQQDANPLRNDRMGSFHDHHGHASYDASAEGETAPANTTSGGASHCGAHVPTEEEQTKLAALLEGAAAWWDEFADDIEDWLEEHGAVVSDWLDENVPEINGLLSDQSGRDGSAGQKSFSARVKVHWIALMPNSGNVEGHTGKLSKKDVDKQMSVMNKAFKGTGFKFVLESFKKVKVPDEQFLACSEDADPLAATTKNTYRKGDATELYIYSWMPCGIEGGLLGYATFPEWFETDPKFDGVVVAYNSLPGGTNKGYDLGMTLVHEVGHWIGLYHTFQGMGCDDKTNDGVDDTPVQAASTSGCPSPQPDTCPNHKGKDPIHNYMDYSTDVCLNKFSKGQIKRMQNAWKLRVKMSKKN